MSRIKNLRLRVRSNTNPRIIRKAYILEKVDESRLRVSWKDTPPKDGDTSTSQLYLPSWRPLTIELLFQDGLKTKILYYRSDESASTIWRKITPLILRKCYAEQTASQFTDEDTRPGGYTNWCDECGEYEYTKGVKTYHHSMAAVIEKYTDSWNAVCISPNSWLDNKLQEAYYSRRQKHNEGEIHE